MRENYRSESNYKSSYGKKFLAFMAAGLQAQPEHGVLPLLGLSLMKIKRRENMANGGSQGKGNISIQTPFFIIKQSKMLPLELSYCFSIFLC